MAGGLQTPTTTKFTRGDLIYLTGTGYTAGAEYEVVRALRDADDDLLDRAFESCFLEESGE